MSARVHAALPLLLLAAGVSPLVAQGFEGVVTLKLTGDRGPMEMVQQVKGDKVRSEMNMGGRGGVMIMDGAAQTMTMLMPSEKMYMTMDLRGGGPMGGPPAPREAPKITKLGTSETIAGRACDNYLVDGEQDFEICAAKGLGFFMMGSGPGARRGPMGRMPDFRDPAFMQQYRDGFYPLRITEVTGGTRKPMMEVTKIEPKPLDASLFQVPAGYQQMSMPGGMGPGGPGRP